MVSRQALQHQSTQARSLRFSRTTPTNPITIAAWGQSLRPFLCLPKLQGLRCLCWSRHHLEDDWDLLVPLARFWCQLCCWWWHFELLYQLQFQNRDDGAWWERPPWRLCPSERCTGNHWCLRMCAALMPILEMLEMIHQMVLVLVDEAEIRWACWCQQTGCSLHSEWSGLMRSIQCRWCQACQCWSWCGGYICCLLPGGVWCCSTAGSWCASAGGPCCWANGSVWCCWCLSLFSAAWCWCAAALHCC